MDKEFSFGGQLKKIRERENLTQQQLATDAGFSQEFIARLEKDRQKPSWETVQKLADALGVPCTDFKESPAEPSKPKTKKKRKGE